MRIEIGFVYFKYRVHPLLQDLVGRLTLDEMVAQMSHGGAESNGNQ